MAKEILDTLEELVQTTKDMLEKQLCLIETLKLLQDTPNKKKIRKVPRSDKTLKSDIVAVDKLTAGQRREAILEIIKEEPTGLKSLVEQTGFTYQNVKNDLMFLEKDFPEYQVKNRGSQRRKLYYAEAATKRRGRKKAQI